MSGRFELKMGRRVKNEKLKEKSNSYQNADLNVIEKLLSKYTLNFSQFCIGLKENDKKLQEQLMVLQIQAVQSSKNSDSETELEANEGDDYYIELLEEKESEIDNLNKQIKLEVEKNKEINKKLEILQNDFQQLLNEHQGCSPIRQQLLLDKLEIINRSCSNHFKLNAN